jgi:putative PIN family toxin of toxin-antitoxin system
MIKAVLDANVVVQALIGSPASASAQTLLALANNRFRLAASTDTLLELAEVLELPVLRARHRLAAREIWELIGILEFYATPLYEPRHIPSKVRDISDWKLLDLAVAAEADFLVTNDRRHLLPLKRFGQTKIVTPAAFLRLLK